MIEYAILATISVGVIMMVAYLSLKTGEVAGKNVAVDRSQYSVPVLYSSID